MSITLDSITLPDGCIWTDETAWAGSSGSVKRTIQGRVIISAQSIPGNSGRTITLGGDVWITRADLLTLLSWTGAAGLEMLLTLHDGRTFQVVFRTWDAPTIEAEQLYPVADAEDADYYVLKSLKLMAVS